LRNDRLLSNGTVKDLVITWSNCTIYTFKTSIAEFVANPLWLFLVAPLVTSIVIYNSCCSYLNYMVYYF